MLQSSCYCFSLLSIEPKYSRVNFSSFWRGPSVEAASLHTYLGTGKWDAPPELSGTSIPRAENADIRGLSDPELSHRLISPANLPFAFSPFSMTPRLQPLIFALLSLLFLSVSPPSLFLSFFQMGARQRLHPQLCAGEGGWPHQSEERSWPRATYLYQKSDFTCLDQGWFLKQQQLSLQGAAGFLSRHSRGGGLQQGGGWEIVYHEAGKQDVNIGKKSGDRVGRWKKKKSSLSSMELCVRKVLEGLGEAFEGKFQQPLEVTEICQMILVPLSGASLAGGTKFILIRMKFLIPF